METIFEMMQEENGKKWNNTQQLYMKRKKKIRFVFLIELILPQLAFNTFYPPSPSPLNLWFLDNFENVSVRLREFPVLCVFCWWTLCLVM